jgi:hypothetical protein
VEGEVSSLGGRVKVFQVQSKVAFVAIILTSCLLRGLLEASGEDGKRVLFDVHSDPRFEG